jgi:hypothetical protein
MAKVIKIAAISKTTTGTITIPTDQLPNVTGNRRSDYIMEITAIGTGDTWQAPTLNWVSPGGVITPVGTFTDGTATGTKAFVWAYAESTAATDMNSVPVNMFKATLQTAGSSSITASIYIVTDGP